MCEGICDKCREKVQWRFNYNRYKSLTKPGSCRECKNKCVTKAYRLFCDPCATKKKACAACGGNIVQLNNERRAEMLARGLIKEESDSEDDGSGDDGDKEAIVEKAAANEANEEEEEEEEDDEDEQTAEDADISKSEGQHPQLDTVFHISDKDVRKMENYGASKYNKSRVVGTAEDAHLMEDLKNQKKV